MDHARPWRSRRRRLAGAGGSHLPAVRVSPRGRRARARASPSQFDARGRIAGASPPRRSVDDSPAGGREQVPGRGRTDGLPEALQAVRRGPCLGTRWTSGLRGATRPDRRLVRSRATDPGHVRGAVRNPDHPDRPPHPLQPGSSPGLGDLPVGLPARIGDQPVVEPTRCTWVLELREADWVIVHWHKSMGMPD